MNSILQEADENISSSNILDKLLKYGVSALFAGYLMWFLVGDLKQEMNGNTSAINGMNQTLSNHVTESALSNRRLESMEKLLQRICVNTAKTNTDRNDCFK